VDKVAIKYKLIEHCIHQLQKTIDNIEYAMNDAQKSANDYGQPKDRYDPYRTQLLRKRDLMAKQLQQAVKQMDILKKVDPEKLSDYAAFGAVVKTENQNIFISVGLGKIELNGQDFVVISPNVPIFEAIRDKKKGEEFEFRGVKQKILDVY
jgi:hypothetical protein